jgi:predicted GIY-YIG superfamily endonuclease
MASASRYILYRIHGEYGELLYVGATTNPSLRFNSHYHGQPWWDEATDIKLQRFATADELETAELHAIRTEHPRYNLLHSKPASWSRKPRAPRGNGSVFRRTTDGMWVASLEVGSTKDGKRRQRRRYAKDRKTAEQKLALLRLEAGL